MYRIVARIIYAILLEQGIDSLISMIDSESYIEKQSRKWIRRDITYHDLIEYARDSVNDINNIPITKEDSLTVGAAIQKDQRLYYLNTLGVMIGHDTVENTMIVDYPQEWDFGELEFDIMYNEDDDSLVDHNGNLLADRDFSSVTINYDTDIEDIGESTEYIDESPKHITSDVSSDVEFYLPAISKEISKNRVDDKPEIDYDQIKSDVQSLIQDPMSDELLDEDEDDIFRIIFGDEWDADDDD